MIKYLDLQKINKKHTTTIELAIKQVVESGWYILGEQVNAFEKEYAQYIGTSHCISCGNGLDALRLILKAYIELKEIQVGDEIIVPANTYIATILAISDVGLVPILVEPNLETLQINDQAIEEKITAQTKAIMLVHLYGRCAYTEQIGKLCQKYHLKLLEDNAQAAGCTYHINAEDKFLSKKNISQVLKTGNLGHASAHSFYPGKNLGALGDAGAITTNDSCLANIIRSLRNYGSSRKYIFELKGTNSRMDELQASILRIKLPYLDMDNFKRIEIAKKYIKEINNPKFTSPTHLYEHNNTFHIFPILCSDRAALQQYMLNKNIETLIHYPIPPHQQQCYKEWHSLSLPITEKIHREEVSIPLHQELQSNEIDYIIETLNNF